MRLREKRGGKCERTVDEDGITVRVLANERAEAEYRYQDKENQVSPLQAEK